MSNPSTFHWTYEDYVRLTVEGESFEFIEGRQFVAPMPTVWHQLTSRNLGFLLMLYLRDNKLGELLHPPVDTVFADDTMLQPDIAVLLNEHGDRLKKEGLFGAPDFVIEILSPSTAARDRREKLAVYARYGVREYWLVDPESARIEVFVLESGRLVKKTEHESGEARSLAVLPGFAAPLEDVFRRP
jgi:Uma2 family endonuclease